VEVEMMTTKLNPPETSVAVAHHPDPTNEARAVPWRTRAVGGFFVAMGGVHIGIVAADTETYRHFADDALFGFVRTGWAEVFMATPILWGLLLAAGEILMGSLLLRGGLPARVGWVCVMTFHVLLMLFGWGIWAWSVPALFVLIRGARTDWRPLGG
jgi:hypothetical protein